MTDPFQQATEKYSHAFYDAILKTGISLKDLCDVLNKFGSTLSEADRNIRVLSKQPKPIHDKQHPFKKFFRV